MLADAPELGWPRLYEIFVSEQHRRRAEAPLAKEAGLKWFELECNFLRQQFADLFYCCVLTDIARPFVDTIGCYHLFIRSALQAFYNQHGSLTMSRYDLQEHMRKLVPFSLFLHEPLDLPILFTFLFHVQMNISALEVSFLFSRHLSPTERLYGPVLYEKRSTWPEWFQKHGIPASRAMNEG
nr:CTD nuclear envelope phosphatase 1 homolog [Ipomoea batatas]